MATTKEKTVSTMELEFIAERVTKNTVRFAEVEHDGVTAVGTLYVQKHALRDIGNPERLKVTIEPAG